MSQTYKTTGLLCEVGQSGIASQDLCFPAAYEIQTIQPDLGSGLVVEPQAPDYAQSAEFWGIAFTTVLFLWLFSHGIGHILKLVKNA